MQYLRHNQINKTKWDESVSKAHNTTPYAYSWFLDIVSPQWDALVNDDYLEIMPLTWRKKFGLYYLCQPMLCPQLGVFSTICKQKFCIDSFIKAIPSKFKVIEIGLNEMNFLSIAVGKHKIIYKQKQSLSLSRTYETISSAYKTSLRKNIERFKRQSTFMARGDFSYTKFYFHKIMRSIDMGWKIRRNDRSVLLNLLEQFQNGNKLKMCFCTDQQNFIVGGICFFDISCQIFIVSFVCEKARRSGFIFSVIDDFIQCNANLPILIDFMGSSLQGVRYRNLGFGSIETTYSFILINRLPRIIQYFIKFLRG